MTALQLMVMDKPVDATCSWLRSARCVASTAVRRSRSAVICEIFLIDLLVKP